MGLAIGVAALFFGVVFIIVGWKGGGTSAMNSNLTGMMKGNYPTGGSGSNSSSNSGTSTSGGTYSPPKKPGTNP